VKVTTEELERCEVLLTLEIEPDQQEKLLKKAAQRISREVRIPGFRPGKAPYNVVLRRFGLEAIQTEALEESVEKLVTEGMAEVKVTPFAQIKLEEVEWEPALRIKVKVPTQPKVELGDYRETRLEAKPVEVTDEDVDQALKQLQDQRATWAPVERPAQLGDLISMTVTEKDGDEVLTERESIEYELTPVAEEDKEKRPDLTTPLLGLSAGDAKTFTVTYPEDFENAEYAGKDITFEVEVSGVKVKKLDPLDDEFAKQMGDYETLDALKAKIREDIQQRRERQNDVELGYQTLEKIIESAEKIEWPLALEEEQIDHEIEHLEHHLQESGLTLESYLRVNNKTKEELREETRGKVVDQLKKGLAMSKVAELVKVGVSQLEILEQAKLMADLFGGGDRVWQNIMASESRQSIIANDLLSNKVVRRLAAIAKGEATASEAEEVEMQDEADEEVAPPEVEADTAEAADESPTASTSAEDQTEDTSTEETVTTEA
jgi:trigger factor